MNYCLPSSNPPHQRGTVSFFLASSSDENRVSLVSTGHSMRRPKSSVNQEETIIQKPDDNDHETTNKGNDLTCLSCPSCCSTNGPVESKITTASFFVCNCAYHSNAQSAAQGEIPNVLCSLPQTRDSLSAVNITLVQQWRYTLAQLQANIDACIFSKDTKFYLLTDSGSVPVTMKGIGRLTSARYPSIISKFPNVFISFGDETTSNPSNNQPQEEQQRQHHTKLGDGGSLLIAIDDGSRCVVPIGIYQASLGTSSGLCIPLGLCLDSLNHCENSSFYNASGEFVLFLDSTTAAHIVELLNC